MTAGFLITFREGLEAFLVVGIILSYLGRCDLKKYNKWVYFGAVSGMLSAFLVGLLFQVYYTGFESKLGEHYLKISIMGLAVIILTYIVIWMTRNGCHIKGDIEKNLEKVISAGSVVTLVMMGYLAILREGFETVLFLGALYGNNMSISAYYGGIMGLLIALSVTIILFRGMRRVPLKSFFNITGVLIMFISAGLLINMIGIMQDIRLLPVLKSGLVDLSWLMMDSSDVGIFFKALFGYTHSPSLIQLISYLCYFAAIMKFLRPSGKQL